MPVELTKFSESSMNTLKILTLGCFSLSPVIAVLPAVAAECRVTQAQPASTTREIVNDEHRLRFEIPSNYHTSLERHESRLRIVVQNPGDVEFEACMSQPGNSGSRRYVATNIAIWIDELPEELRRSPNLRNYVASQESSHREHTFVEQITIDGQTGVFFIEKFAGNVSRYPETNQYAYVLHPDGQHLIRIRAWQLGSSDIEEVDAETHSLILSTLSFF